MIKKLVGRIIQIKNKNLFYKRMPIKETTFQTKQNKMKKLKYVEIYR